MSIYANNDRQRHARTKPRSQARRPPRTSAKPFSRRHPVGGWINGWAIAVMLAAGIALHLFPDFVGKVSARVEAVTGVTPPWPHAASSSPTFAAASDVERAAARAMPICGDGRRVNCVVDGDTIWVDREKIRLESIDAPEIHGQCAYETDLAAAATRRLSALLSQHAMSIRRSGTDIYGRTLARISVEHGEVGAALVGEGLARPWAGRRRPWCNA